MQKTLRCYVKKENTQWVAVCIDLSLAAQANSSKEAISKLESMIQTYIEDALGKHKEYAEQLLSRKAPLSQRFFYHWSVVQKFLSKVFHYSNRHWVFSEPYTV
jgi:predicted RNase H-like HicB family nuclease